MFAKARWGQGPPKIPIRRRRRETIQGQGAISRASVRMNPAADGRPQRAPYCAAPSVMPMETSQGA
jgi:hypothetical protein